MSSPSHILVLAGDNEVELLPSINAIRNRHLLVCQRDLYQEPPEGECPARDRSDSNPDAKGI